MNEELHMAVRKVLADSAQAAHFFDLSDAERLNWMIERAYELGKQRRVAEQKLRQGARRRRPNPVNP